MRQVFFVFAILGALISGWVPAVAATLDAGQRSGIHAMHDMSGEDGDTGHDSSKPAAHPIACSACFAIETAHLAPPNRLFDISAHVRAAMPQLAGLVLRPLDPPPRS